MDSAKRSGSPRSFSEITAISSPTVSTPVEIMMFIVKRVGTFDPQSFIVILIRFCHFFGTFIRSGFFLFLLFFFLFFFLFALFGNLEIANILLFVANHIFLFLFFLVRFFHFFLFFLLLFFNLFLLFFLLCILDFFLMCRTNDHFFTHSLVIIIWDTFYVVGTGTIYTLIQLDRLSIDVTIFAVM